MNDAVEVIESEGNTGVVRSSDTQAELFFKMHQKINAKSEEISNSYNNNILVRFSDIKELHEKTIQSIDSLKAEKSSINIRIIVSHNEGESEKFNSFSAFETCNLTSPNPTSDIILVYLFSIYDRDACDFENYKVICHIRSRVAELQKIEKEAPPFLSSALISSMVTTTAKISIHYNDYVKARHFTAMFDEWIKGCDESNNIEFFNKLKRFSHLIPRLGRISIYAALGLYTIFKIDSVQMDSTTMLKFLVAYASVFVIIGGVTEMILRKVEMSIDSYLAMSYLNINKGDAKLIAQYSGKNKHSAIWSVVGILGTICMGVVASATYDFIKWLIS